MERSIGADESVRFGIFYGMSNNDWLGSTSRMPAGFSGTNRWIGPKTVTPTEEIDDDE